MWRQGDILIQQIEAIPGGLARRKRLVLASGDTSGHSHKIKDRRTANLFLSASPWSSDMYLEVTEEMAEVVHPEHATIPLPKGCYRVWRQREFTERGASTVLD
jgi:hypothetical protein